VAYEPRPMSDPRVLRAIAHPMRARILDEFDLSTTLRAADVADLLDIPANQASFHLRQLAKYGLIVAAPEAARDKRDRVYRRSDRRAFQLDVDDIEAEPGGKAALSVFRQSKAAWAHRLVDEVFSFKKQKDTFSAIVDQNLRLSKAEAAQFMGEVDEVLARWVKGSGGGGRGLFDGGGGTPPPPPPPRPAYLCLLLDGPALSRGLRGEVMRCRTAPSTPRTRGCRLGLGPGALAR
jgi:DNA-binding transcriptional ArsR family regulator